VAHQVVVDLSHQMHVTLVPMLKNLTDQALMASDGYHPSAAGAAMWGRQLATAVAPQLKIRKKNTSVASTEPH